MKLSAVVFSVWAIGNLFFASFGFATSGGYKDASKIWFEYQRSSEYGSSGHLVVTNGKATKSSGPLVGADIREWVKDNPRALELAKKQITFSYLGWGSIVPMGVAEVISLNKFSDHKNSAGFVWLGACLTFAASFVYFNFLSQKYFYKAIDEYNGTTNYHPQHLANHSSADKKTYRILEGFRFRSDGQRSSVVRYQDYYAENKQASLSQRTGWESEWKSIQINIYF